MKKQPDVFANQADREDRAREEQEQRETEPDSCEPEAESDEAWMRRVYPQHMWTPADGIPYPQFCRLSRAKWEAEHTEVHDELTTLRQQHAAAVEAAFREGYGEGVRWGAYLPGVTKLPPSDEDAAWLASEAKARLT